MIELIMYSPLEQFEFITVGIIPEIGITEWVLNIENIRNTGAIGIEGINNIGIIEVIEYIKNYQTIIEEYPKIWVIIILGFYTGKKIRKAFKTKQQKEFVIGLTLMIILCNMIIYEFSSTWQSLILFNSLIAIIKLRISFYEKKKNPIELKIKNIPKLIIQSMQINIIIIKRFYNALKEKQITKIDFIFCIIIILVFIGLYIIIRKALLFSLINNFDNAAIISALSITLGVFVKTFWEFFIWNIGIKNPKMKVMAMGLWIPLSAIHKNFSNPLTQHLLNSPQLQGSLFELAKFFYKNASLIQNEHKDACQSKYLIKNFNSPRSDIQEPIKKYELTPQQLTRLIQENSVLKNVLEQHFFNSKEMMSYRALEENGKLQKIPFQSAIFEIEQLIELRMLYPNAWITHIDLPKITRGPDFIIQNLQQQAKNQVLVEWINCKKSQGKASFIEKLLESLKYENIVTNQDDFIQGPKGAYYQRRLCITNTEEKGDIIAYKKYDEENKIVTMEELPYEMEMEEALHSYTIKDTENNETLLCKINNKNQGTHTMGKITPNMLYKKSVEEGEVEEKIIKVLEGNPTQKAYSNQPQPVLKFQKKNIEQENWLNKQIQEKRAGINARIEAINEVFTDKKKIKEIKTIRRI